MGPHPRAPARAECGSRPAQPGSLRQQLEHLRPCCRSTQPVRRQPVGILPMARSSAYSVIRRRWRVPPTWSSTSTRSSRESSTREFLLLFLIAHSTRLAKRSASEAGPADCWIEAWRDEAVDTGTRALDRLRAGVEEALTQLGDGFLHHPLTGGSSTPSAPARSPTVTTSVRFCGWSTGCCSRSWRRTATRCWIQTALHQRNPPTPSTSQPPGCAGSPGSVLAVCTLICGRPNESCWLPWAATGCPNWRFLPSVDSSTPIRAQGASLPSPVPTCSLVRVSPTTPSSPPCGRSRGSRSRAVALEPVDYRNLGAEELGSVYESLLELIPRVDLADMTFRLETTAGNDRKTTGSYYTPPALVSALLDTALDPLLDDAGEGNRQPQSCRRPPLGPDICDPGLGSGGFLVAAARRVARRLAQVRSGEDEPTPESVQHASVTWWVAASMESTSIDLAAELAKVSLCSRRWTRQTTRLPRCPHPCGQLAPRHDSGAAGRWHPGRRLQGDRR